WKTLPQVEDCRAGAGGRLRSWRRRKGARSVGERSRRTGSFEGDQGPASGWGRARWSSGTWSPEGSALLPRQVPRCSCGSSRGDHTRGWRLVIMRSSAAVDRRGAEARSGKAALPDGATSSGEAASLDGTAPPDGPVRDRSEEHTSELQSRENLVCRLLLEKKK